jgi:hypothetical protein
MGDGGYLLLQQQPSASFCRRKPPGLTRPLIGTLAKGLVRHGVVLRREERVDDVGDLAGIVPKVARRLLPALEIATLSALLWTKSDIAAMNTGILSTFEKSMMDAAMGLGDRVLCSRCGSSYLAISRR